MSDLDECGPYHFGADNAYHTAERTAEQAALRSLLERLGRRIEVDLYRLAQSAGDPSKRACARIAALERENATLRREAFAAGTHRERELIDLQVEVRRLQREGLTAERLAKALHEKGKVEVVAKPAPSPAAPPKSRLPPEVQRRYAKAEAHRLEQERIAADMVARLQARMHERQKHGPEAFEEDDRL